MQAPFNRKLLKVAVGSLGGVGRSPGSFLERRTKLDTDTENRTRVKAVKEPYANLYTISVEVVVLKRPSELYIRGVGIEPTRLAPTDLKPVSLTTRTSSL